MSDKEYNLVILGNGFDLQCNLKSDYLSYFEYREQNNQELLTKFRKIISLGKDQALTTKDIDQIKQFANNYGQRLVFSLTIWDWLFFSTQALFDDEKNYGWANIEQCIAEFVVPSSQKKTIKINSEDLKEGLLAIAQQQGYGEKTQPQSLHFADNYIRVFAMLLYFIKESPSFQPSSGNQLQDKKRRLVSQVNHNLSLFLYEQLELFEKDFKNYIKTISKTKEYLDKSKALLKLIIDNSCHTIRVLNFNYTVPFARIKPNKQYEIDCISNVHGSIGNKKNIIFGIDQLTIAGNSPAYRFTKTARKMHMLSRSDEPAMILTNSCKKIFIYGHALSEFDYSYYQSIFDYFSIYDSQIELVFLYTIYNNQKADRIKSDMTEAVIKLLLTYGESKENTIIGKNLIHKLLLENRLIIDKVTALNYLK